MTTHDDDRRETGATGRDERFDALLAESGIAAEPGDALVRALAELAAVGADEPPAPSPDLSRLLAPDPVASHSAARRRRTTRRTRITIATITAAACLSGIGVAAAAAGNMGFRHSLGHTFSVIVSTLTGTRHEAPGPLGNDPLHPGSPSPQTPEAARTIILPSAGGTAAPAPPPSGTPQGHATSGRSVTAIPSVILPGRAAQRPTPVAPESAAAASRSTVHPTAAATAPVGAPGTGRADPTAAPSGVPGTATSGTHP
ncbi:MAG: hypothetical protein M0Z51_05080 [Propionibacterium sp.]|nr:hypothetical protein [Propionibacterium sp.]